MAPTFLHRCSAWSYLYACLPAGASPVLGIHLSGRCDASRCCGSIIRVTGDGMPYGVLQTYRQIGRMRVNVHERPLAGVTSIKNFANSTMCRFYRLILFLLFHYFDLGFVCVCHLLYLSSCMLARLGHGSCWFYSPFFAHLPFSPVPNVRFPA